MARTRFPASGHSAVKAALDVVRINLRDIGEWLKGASPGGNPVVTDSLNNYRDGRREMPVKMRRLLAKQLRRQADRLRTAASNLEITSGESPPRGRRR